MSGISEKPTTGDRPRVTEKEWVCMAVASCLVVVIAAAIVLVVYAVYTRLFDF